MHHGKSMGEGFCRSLGGVHKFPLQNYKIFYTGTRKSDNVLAISHQVNSRNILTFLK